MQKWEGIMNESCCVQACSWTWWNGGLVMIIGASHIWECIRVLWFWAHEECEGLEGGVWFYNPRSIGASSCFVRRWGANRCLYKSVAWKPLYIQVGASSWYPRSFSLPWLGWSGVFVWVWLKSSRFSLLCSPGNTSLLICSMVDDWTQKVVTSFRMFWQIGLQGGVREMVKVCWRFSFWAFGFNCREFGFTCNLLS